MSSSIYEKSVAWCSSVNGELRTRRRVLVVHGDPKPGPGLEVFVPEKDTTEKTNYVALVRGIAQILASMVAIIVMVTRRGLRQELSPLTHLGRVALVATRLRLNVTGPQGCRATTSCRCHRQRNGTAVETPLP